MNVMANSGVVRLTIGMDTTAAMIKPAPLPTSSSADSLLLHSARPMMQEGHRYSLRLSECVPTHRRGPRAQTMATRQKKKKPRTFTFRQRQGLDRAAEHYLRECYRQKKPVRVNDFARSLGLTPEYVSFLGSEIVGGLQAFLRNKQLASAGRLLRRTPLSIDEIAARSGFGTRSTMRRWFLKVHGVSPAAFRGPEK